MKHSVLMVVVMLMPMAVTASPLMYVPTGNANDLVIIDLGAAVDVIGGE